MIKSIDKQRYFKVIHMKMNGVAPNECKSPSNRTIYTFWEPRDELIPYLELCKETWEIHLTGYTLVTLDYSNYHHYIDSTVLDLSTLKHLPLQVQKDAFMVAVLYQNGGVFIDLDTIILHDITPIIDCLKHSEVVMFNTHLAFVAARAGSTLLAVWLLGIQGRLSYLRKTKRYQETNWDFIGNSVLRDSMDALVKVTLSSSIIQNDRGGKIHKMALNKISSNMQDFSHNSSRLMNSLRSRWRLFFFRRLLGNYLLMLDRKKYGFIQEACYFTDNKLTGTEKYLKFWFENNLDPHNIIDKTTMAIGLHNSWTPNWYKNLSKAEVLEQDCLLSKTLSGILQGKSGKE